MHSTVFALLGAVGGGALRLLPEMLGAWASRQQKGNAVRLAELHLEEVRAELAARLDIAKLGAENIEAEGRLAVDKARAESMVIAQQAQSHLTGVRWADALNLSVRPIATYLMLLLYIAFKLIVIRDAVIQAEGPTSATVTSLVAIVWNEEDAAIFAGVLTFWFADSVLVRRSKRP
ncbi:MAG TPA: hypothetical protein VJU59_33610 [Paraburkholderia sp.]|uniref:hypothetical protein n=1 Tax=Paraburkholderia sp. TaxID=1926495 RepID=UPI002B48A104|nr:hypothetical protein [Paraburkholderia sp.]HKR44556.1 hypothetical protein [Paraburkholderia sp.]